MVHITNANDFYNTCLFLYIDDKKIVNKTTVIKNTEFGLKIKYKYEDTINNCFNFTLFEKNMKWNELSSGYIKTDIYSDNLKMDIVLSNKTPFVQFIDVLEQSLKTILLRNNYLNKYNIVIKKTIVEKDNIYYFNNIKFNYYKKDDEKKLLTKVYIKKKEDDNIKSVLLDESEINNVCVDTGFYILPIISLKTLYFKKQNKILNVYPQFFLNSLTLYNKYNNKQMLDEESNIDEEG